MHLFPRIGLAITLSLLAIKGALAADVPPLNSPATNESHPGKFIWADLFTDDTSAATAFYTGLFGWTATVIDRPTKDGTKPYTILHNGDRPVAGIYHRPTLLKDAAHGRWVGYISVPDVVAALKAATDAGGKIVTHPKKLVDRGEQGVFADSDGALVGVMHSGSGDPGEYLADPGDWVWAELFARDPVQAGKAYGQIAGYECQPDNRTPRPDDSILISGGFSRASILPLPNKPKAHAAWLFFVRVANVKEATEKAVKLGGRVAVAPDDSQGQGWRAVVVDPAGVHIGLLELPAAPAKKDEAP
ncbi:MAG TPA: VOC family protein [Candidatus Didemnitutus sp.]|nr:VOC family protein [Candidatus Didemnitutus sp.]